MIVPACLSSVGGYAKSRTRIIGGPDVALGLRFGLGIVMDVAKDFRDELFRELFRFLPPLELELGLSAEGNGGDMSTGELVNPDDREFAAMDGARDAAFDTGRDRRPVGGGLARLRD